MKDLKSEILALQKLLNSNRFSIQMDSCELRLIEYGGKDYQGIFNMIFAILSFLLPNYQDDDFPSSDDNSNSINAQMKRIVILGKDKTEVRGNGKSKILENNEVLDIQYTIEEKGGWLLIPKRFVSKIELAVDFDSHLLSKIIFINKHHAEWHTERLVKVLKQFYKIKFPWENEKSEAGSNQN